MAVEQLSGADEIILLLSVAGGCLAIILVVGVLIKLTHDIRTMGSNVTTRKETRSFMNTKAGKIIIALTYATLILYLLACSDGDMELDNALTGDGDGDVHGAKGV